MRWRVTIEVYPRTADRGVKVDQEAAGDRVQYFYVDARDIDEALKMAHCFSYGVGTNPAVGDAPVVGVHRYDRGAGTDALARTEVRSLVLRTAADIARNGCLVPPDGGSPTVAEAEMCERIADAILRLEAP